MSDIAAPEADAAASAVDPVLHPDGWALLNSLEATDDTDSLALGTRLRAEGHPPERVAAALTQARLRRRARDKFGDFAASMLFTPHGLEQATRLAVAAHHASRFETAQVPSVADLGCGIGGDAMALAGLGREVLAVDRDPVTVAVATVNLRPFPNATVRQGTVEGHEVGSTEGIWLDPARRRSSRGGTRRLHAPEEYEPPLSTVLDIARRLGRDGQAGPLGVKLGPAVDREALPADTETQWLSWHGQVLEAVCFFGPLAAPGVRSSALVIDRDGTHRLTSEGRHEDAEPALVGSVGAHLYEPDGAVLRAGLLGRLAEDLHAGTIDPTIAYLSGDALVCTPFARGYTVRDVIPFHLKKLTAYLREHRLGILEIKKRGTAVEPEELRRRLRPRRFGDGRATLVLTRIGGRQHVIVADPHPTPDAPTAPEARTV